MSTPDSPSGKPPAKQTPAKPANTVRRMPPKAPRVVVKSSGPGLGTVLFRLLLVAAVAGAGYMFWREYETARAAKESARKAEEQAAAQAALEKQAEKPQAGAGDFADLKDLPPDPVKVAPAPMEPSVNELITQTPAGNTPIEIKEYGLNDLREGVAALEIFAKERHKFTQPVEAAYINFMKAKTRAALKELGRELPSDFLAWAENDQERALAIFGTHKNPAEFLCWLRSLEIDVGADAVRSKHTPLAFAIATVATAQGMTPDIKPRPPLKLVIGGDPRVPVNTKDPKRTLDMNDHIINFLEDHAPISGDIVGGMAEALPELVYDSRGVATSLKKKKNATPKVKRTLIAADVFASAELQKEFNQYMKSKGFDVSIDCGDRVIFPGQTEGIEAPYEQKIAEAFKLFRTAYEEKGRLALCDKPATPAERFAYIIRNDTKSAFPDTYGPQKNKLIEFPLNSPWPMLTFLAADDQPLREREDVIMRLKKKGVFYTYGEYIGGIAQQGTMQRARRLSPYEFGYRTGPSHVGRDPMAMMIKDGGVCGTMAAMCVCSYNIVNVPATTAGQPGHCALIYAKRDPKSRKYTFDGGHFVTAGPEGTHPHTPWYFGDLNKQKPMIWHLAAAYAVNFSEKAFMQSLTAQQFIKALPDELRTAHEKSALINAVTINPYNINLATEAISATTTAKEMLQLRQTLKSSITSSSGKAGIESNGGLYLKTLEDISADYLRTLPKPTDENTEKIVSEILAKRSAELAAEAAAKAAKEAAEKAAKEGETPPPSGKKTAFGKSTKK